MIRKGGLTKDAVQKYEEVIEREPDVIPFTISQIDKEIAGHQAQIDLLKAKKAEAEALPMEE
jgi:hypothetical protein